MNLKGRNKQTRTYIHTHEKEKANLFLFKEYPMIKMKILIHL
jgi:hypothetical protein